MRFKLKHLNIINPFYYIGKKKTEKLEREMWGEYEQDGVDIIEIMDVNTEKHSRYQITRPQHMEFVTEYLSKQGINQQNAIIDLGCGKGGMLKVFSNFNFGLIAGLEFLPELCDIANDNLKLWNIKANVINADAMEYSDYDSFDYFYMYNPFGEEIMKKVVENIDKSLMSKPREIHVIYANPTHGDLFRKNGYDIEKKFKMSLMFTQAAVVYIKKG